MGNLKEIIERIEKARLSYNSRHIVKIVAASKYVSEKEIEAVYHEGQRAFGENKIQDMKQKMAQLDALPIEWHYIGRIQTNKINMLLDSSVSLIHSVDSFETALEIDKRAALKGVRPHILLQINSAHEETKAGVEPDKAVDTYTHIQETLSHVQLHGVMSIGAHSDDTHEIKNSFERCRGIFEALSPQGATICSMGMSGDFELAVACGSNMVRIGSAIFR